MSHVERFRFPRSPKEANKRVNPASSVEFRYFDDSLGIFCHDIPYADDTYQLLPNTSGIFDILHLATDELEKNTTKERYIDGGFQDVDMVSRLLRRDISRSNPNYSSQYLALRNDVLVMLFGVGYQKDSVFQRFLNRVQQQKKPFLIVYGHGDRHLDTNGRWYWSVAQKNGLNCGSMERVLDALEPVNRYSAILYIVCNPADIKLRTRSAQLYHPLGDVVFARKEHTMRRVRVKSSP